MEEQKVVAVEGTARQKTLREVQADKYGSWFSAKNSAAEMVAWCNGRIAKYTKWIAECEALRAENQKKLLQGMTKEQLLAMAESL